MPLTALELIITLMAPLAMASANGGIYTCRKVLSGMIALARSLPFAPAPYPR